LSKLASGAEVEPRFGGGRSDRHGHALAQVFVASGEKRLWLQEELVAKGLARVYSFADNRACVAELLPRENEARAKRLGVWGSWAYRVQSADDAKRLGRLTHSYQLIEGTVLAVGEGGGRIYLNFAKDWRSDFTIGVERKDVSAFTAGGIDLKGLAGKRVRVRGWVEWRNGPMIAATHSEQIELLPDAPAKGETKPKSPPSGAIAL
jgi:micrococcal nuclease